MSICKLHKYILRILGITYLEGMRGDGKLRGIEYIVRFFECVCVGEGSSQKPGGIVFERHFVWNSANSPLKSHLQSAIDVAQE